MNDTDSVDSESLGVSTWDAALPTHDKSHFPDADLDWFIQDHPHSDFEPSLFVNASSHISQAYQDLSSISYDIPAEEEPARSLKRSGPSTPPIYLQEALSKPIIAITAKYGPPTCGYRICNALIEQRHFELLLALQDMGEVDLTDRIFSLNGMRQGILQYAPEAKPWYETKELDVLAQDVTVPGLSPKFPQVHCTANGDVCQITSGLGIVNAASSIVALWSSPIFNLTRTYFLVAGIAGINPHEALTGSATLAQYVVNLDIRYGIAHTELPSNYSSGYFPMGTNFVDPDNSVDHPHSLFGWEVFELNANLFKRAV